MHLCLAVAFRAQAKPGDQAPPFTDFWSYKRMKKPAPLEGGLGESVKEYMRRNYFHNTRGEPTLDLFGHVPEEKMSLCVSSRLTGSLSWLLPSIS